MGRKCYAAALGGCAPRLTKEHYISDGIIKVMEKLGPMKVAGVSDARERSQYAPSLRDSTIPQRLKQFRRV